MTAALATLNPAAQVALVSCEQRIERGLKTFIDVGQALAEIRDSRLYKGTHDTFEDYCRERWGFSRQRAQQFTAAAELATTMVDTGLPEPTNERQTRALAAVPEPERAEVWREAVDRTDGKPTAKVVSEIAKERTAPETPEPATATTAPVAGSGTTSPDPELATEPEPERHLSVVPAPESERPALTPKQQQIVEDAQRTQAIANARKKAGLLVFEVSTLVTEIVSGVRYGEPGLITAEMVAGLRAAADRLESYMEAK